MTDALLGAAALGDIGEMFPNTDEANRGRDSGEMLTLAAGAAAAKGYEIANLDCIVFAERPKLLPYKLAMRQNLAKLLGLELAQVNVKAKTGEAVGPIGRLEAIQAECIVLLSETGQQA